MQISYQLMGIINCTPDSFSDTAIEGTRNIDQILTMAQEAIDHGVSILDVGGESTRPGATLVSVDDECQRVVPVVKALVRTFPKVLVSVDTRKPEVANATLSIGAGLINDVSGLQFGGEAMAKVVAKFNAKLVIMHSQGLPTTMQHNPQYNNVTDDVLAFLKQQIAVAHRVGIADSHIIVDPGFGFGKTVAHNITLLQQLDAIVQALPNPVLVGLSRKSFLAQPKLVDKQTSTLAATGIAPQQREALTGIAHAMALAKGASLFRIHCWKTQAPVFGLLQALM
jgi:dihydropteroate synthase